MRPSGPGTLTRKGDSGAPAPAAADFLFEGVIASTPLDALVMSLTTDSAASEAMAVEMATWAA